ncbi:MAG: alpha/beta fold hydrolase [Steroidobacteraceae bacterium]
MKMLLLLIVEIALSALVISKPVQAANFTQCKDSSTAAALHGTLCATFQLPLRASGPRIGDAGKTVNLFVRKFPAPGHTQGTVWLVSGGPGESGATFYPFLKTLRAAFPGFDLLIPDPRGTGFSTRLCPKEESVGSPGGLTLVGAEWNTCWATINAAPDYARAFSLTNAAYDLAGLIAQYPSRVPLYVYGVSYGTQVVSRMLVLPHKHLAGVILDSLVPPDATKVWDLSHRSRVVDEVGLKVLKQCDANASCRGLFDTTAEDAYKKLLTAPPPRVLAQIPGKNVKQFFGTLLNFPSLRARIPKLIAQLNRGNTTGLQSVKASLAKITSVFAPYPQSPPSIPLVAIISDSENDARPRMTKREVAKEQQHFLFTSSIPGLLINPSLPLYSHDKYFNAAPTSLPHMLVLQGTRDPKTPLPGALARIAQWPKDARVRLVQVTGSPHFILMTSPTCFKEAVRQFVSGKRGALPACAHPVFRQGF